jgi:MFS family permease
MAVDIDQERPGPQPRERGVLRRMTLATAWGEGLDGYDLGVLSVVLPIISIELGLSPLWAGLIGASALLGIFFGSPVIGWLTDRFGRKRLFLIDISAFVVLGVLQGVVNEPWQLFVVRLLLGVAIGAEYAIGAAMLAEFAPSRGRGRRLSKLLVSWYVGFLMSVVLGYLLVDLAGLTWRCGSGCRSRRAGSSSTAASTRPAPSSTSTWAARPTSRPRSTTARRRARAGAGCSPRSCASGRCSSACSGRATSRPTSRSSPSPRWCSSRCSSPTSGRARSR